MIDLSFKLTGTQKLRSLLSRLMGSDPIYDALSESGRPLFADVRNYEAPAVSSYQRTFALMNSWRYEVKRSFSSASIKITSENIAAPFVRGANTQAWMHKNRWRTDEQIAQAHNDRIVRAIDDAFTRRINNGQ